MQPKTAQEQSSEIKTRSGEHKVEISRSETAVSVQGLSKSFRKAVVLDDISFDVSEGESLVLLGASGSGKTTILRIIAGLENPDKGTVFLHGKDVTELPARERGVGVIFQDYALFPRMTIEKNIGYGLRIRGKSRSEINEAVDRLLTLVRLEEHRGKYPSQLSGGQQQRVSIARALAYKPQVLLFDEPFGALDAQTRVRLRREIRALLRQVNVPSVFITHDQEEALELGDRIAILNTGHIEQIGTPYEVYNRPETEYVATFLGAANLLIGNYNNKQIEIGLLSLPVEEATKKFHDGQTVKLVFRPEDVVLSKEDSLPENCRRLSFAIVEEINFVGAYERLSLRMALMSQPTEDEPSIYADTTTEKKGGVSIIATRVKLEADNIKLNVGDIVTIGLTSYRVIPSYTLASERASRLES